MSSTMRTRKRIAVLESVRVRPGRHGRGRSGGLAPFNLRPKFRAQRHRRLDLAAAVKKDGLQRSTTNDHASSISPFRNPRPYHPIRRHPLAEPRGRLPNASRVRPRMHRLSPLAQHVLFRRIPNQSADRRYRLPRAVPLLLNALVMSPHIGTYVCTIPIILTRSSADDSWLRILSYCPYISQVRFVLRDCVLLDKLPALCLRLEVLVVDGCASGQVPAVPAMWRTLHMAGAAQCVADRLRVLTCLRMVPPNVIFQQLTHLESFVLSTLPMVPVTLPRTLRHFGYHGNRRWEKETLMVELRVGYRVMTRPYSPFLG
ncbi:hypothetical protein FA95DRAFT_633138 [Auriscalpium vulgare]|uniref:Uncharacterized protein n=1 Tax=Auriscalpium vulgare TaxID=40419 RepID=A0ACB8RE29_9AGAM|nr:hypothetical protein FA95DRAFT_633138 [Auriscalpium vulgare]